MKSLNKVILVTGCAGFIGASLSKKFLREGFNVIGIDNINNYYDQNLKLARLKDIEDLKNIKKNSWKFLKVSIHDENALNKIFLENKPDIVINLAAQAGVRYSIMHPEYYVQSNLIGFFNILDNCKKYKVDHLVYASSSSVYGSNIEYPFRENDNISNPLSFYAATKLSNEMMAFSYSNIYKIPITGLRYFTVYGPWGRPDMAPMIFSKKICERKPISIFNYGKMNRDFTFIDDIVEATYLTALKPPLTCSEINQFDMKIPNQIFNIGFGESVNLDYFIGLLEDALSIKAIRQYEAMQLGDVEKTFADTSKLVNWIGYKPKIKIEDGIKIFAKWFLKYYS